MDRQEGLSEGQLVLGCIGASRSQLQAALVPSVRHGSCLERLVQR